MDAVASMHKLLDRNGGDERSHNRPAAWGLFVNAQPFDVEAARFHDAEELLYYPAPAIKIGHRKGLVRIVYTMSGQQMSVDRFAWRRIDFPHIHLGEADRPQRLTRLAAGFGR